MKRSAALIIFSCVIAFLAVQYTSCTQSQYTVRHTILGNPMAPLSSQFVFGICSTLKRCHPEIEIEQCQAGLLNTSGFSAPLGLPSTYTTLASVVQAEQVGTLIGNSSGGNTCHNSIDALNCSDPAVTSAYLASSPTPYSGSPAMVSGDFCGNIFTQITKYTCSTKVFLRGAVNDSNGPTSAGVGYTYSILPALPAGLSLDTSTGIISGTPTAVTAMTSYTVTATGQGTSTTSTVNIRSADGYRINDLADDGKSGPGCRTANGTCTLRAAAEAINSVANPHVIVLPKGQINFGSQIALSNPADIYGDCEQNTSLDGGNVDRVLEVSANGSMELYNLNIQNGRITTGGPYGPGLLLSGNTSTLTVTIKSSSFLNNSASGGGWYGGAILAWDTGPVNLIIDNVTFQGNTADSRAGAIFVSGTTNLTVTNSAFIQNTGTGSGGAISVDGTANISNTVFASNRSLNNYGGAVDLLPGATGNFTNVTFNDNRALRGGALYTNTGSTVNVTNCTLTNNQAAQSGGGSESYGVLNYKNTIVAFNTDPTGPNNCSGNPTSLGNNISPSASGVCNFTQGSDKASTDPKLGSFQNNGGFSSSLLPLAGSPAIDQGSNVGCPSTDQRGFARPFNGTCDIGALEVQ